MWAEYEEITMTRRIGLSLSCIVFLIGISCSSHRAATRDQEKKWPASRIVACIQNPNCHERFIVAHRGLGFGAPENSREAIRRAGAHDGVVVEIDLRQSKDGKVYVLHDKTLDRTTSGTGFLADKIQKELEGIYLANGESVPLFEEIYHIAKNYNVILDLDFKNPEVTENIARFIAANGSFNDVIFFASGIENIKIAARIKKRYPEMIVMPRIRSVVDLEVVREVFDSMPMIIHTDLDYEQILLVHKVGSKTFTHMLSTEYICLIPFGKHLFFQEKQRTLSFANFVQTDYPWCWSSE